MEKRIRATDKRMGSRGVFSLVLWSLVAFSLSACGGSGGEAAGESKVQPVTKAVTIHYGQGYGCVIDQYYNEPSPGVYNAAPNPTVRVLCFGTSYGAPSGPILFPAGQVTEAMVSPGFIIHSYSFQGDAFCLELADQNPSYYYSFCFGNQFFTGESVTLSLPNSTGYSFALPLSGSANQKLYNYLAPINQGLGFATSAVGDVVEQCAVTGNHYVCPSFAADLNSPDSLNHEVWSMINTY